MLALVLASNSDVHLSDVSPELAAAAAIATGIWLLLLLAFAFSTRSRDVVAGAATMDLGKEPPALVDYLVTECKTSDRAIAGTLLDLAARHFLAVEDRGEETVVRVGTQPPQNLLPYEEMLYEHVADLAHGGVVPAAALSTGTAGHALAWHKKFDKLVINDATSRGFSEDRWSAQTWGIERLVGLVAGLLVIAAAYQVGLTEPAVMAVLITGLSAHQGLRSLFGDQRLTESGVEAASRWLGVKQFLQDQGEGFHDLPAGSVVLWDQYMAYACTLGLARTAMKSLPMGAEDDHKAWSDYGGSWRPVKVRYPRTRLVWGRTPAGVLFVGVVMMALGFGGIWAATKLYGFGDGFSNTDEVARWIQTIALGFGAVAIFLALWGLTNVNLGFVDAGKKREIQGRVVRCRAYSRGNNNGTDYFMAVDDGTDDTIKAWIVTSGQYSTAGEGAIVKATITPRQAHVYDISVITPAHVDPSAAPEAKPVAEDVPQVLAQAFQALSASQTAGLAAGAITLLSADELSQVLGQPFTAPRAMAPNPLMQVQHYTAASGHEAVTVMAARGPVAVMGSSFGGHRGATTEVDGTPAMLRDDAIVLTPPGAMLAIRLEHMSGDHEAVLRTLGSMALKKMSAQPATPA